MWKRTKKLKEENAITNFENKYNISLPGSIRDLILENNGGRPTVNTITINNREYSIGWLLSYNEEDIYSIYKVIEYFMNKYNKKVLPFATEDSGDYYCVDLEKNVVVYWNHESDELTEIVDSIEKFLSSFS